MILATVNVAGVFFMGIAIGCWAGFVVGKAGRS